jgi:acetyl esterase
MGVTMANLHPQIQKVLEAMARLDLKPIEAMTPAEARAQMEMMAASRRAEPLPTKRIENRTIPGPTGEIPVRIYWPNAAGKLPAIAYYHGGGHVIGSLDSHDLIARNLCGGAEAVVVSIDYRMGPEHRFLRRSRIPLRGSSGCTPTPPVLEPTRSGSVSMATAPAQISRRWWR